MAIFILSPTIWKKRKCGGNDVSADAHTDEEGVLELELLQRRCERRRELRDAVELDRGTG
jgi:hypothetical protein